jgi:hypothetical protein
MFDNRASAQTRLLHVIQTPNATLHEKEAAHGMAASIEDEHTFVYGGQTKVVGANLPINTKI